MKIIQGDGFILHIYAGWSERDLDDDNLDVHVILPNGERYVGTFYTLKNVDTLMAKWQRTRDETDGSYFGGDPAMVIIRQLTEKTLLGAVTKMIEMDHLARMFERAEDGE